MRAFSGSEQNQKKSMLRGNHIAVVAGKRTLKHIISNRWIENLLSLSVAYSEAHKHLIPLLYYLSYRQSDVAEGIEHLENLLEIFGGDMPVHLQSSGDIGMA